MREIQSRSETSSHACQGNEFTSETGFEVIEVYGSLIRGARLEEQRMTGRNDRSDKINKAGEQERPGL